MIISRVFLWVVLLVGIVQANELLTVIPTVWKVYSTTSATYGPTNGENGIIQWRSASYDPAPDSIFFIVELTPWVGGGESGQDTAMAILYDRDATDSIVEVHCYGGAGVGAFKSINIASRLTSLDSVNLDVRVKADASGHTVELHAAELLIYQNGTIAKTRIFIPMMGRDSLSNATFAEPINHPIRELWTSADWPSDSIHVYYEATMRRRHTTGTAWAALYTTGGTKIDSIGTTDSTDFERKRTVDIFASLANATEYTTRLKRPSAGKYTTIAGAFLIVDLVNAPQKLVGFYPVSWNDYTYIGDAPYPTATWFRYEPNKFNGVVGTKAYFYEATLYTFSETWSWLEEASTYFNADTIHTTTTSFIRGRTDELTDIPTTFEANLFAYLQGYTPTTTNVLGCGQLLIKYTNFGVVALPSSRPEWILDQGR